jgi:VWFA-related protein
LTIKDFEIYEEGELQKIEAVYLIKKTNIEREETQMKKAEARKIFAPQTSRSFILMFEIYEYFPKVGKAIEYFFNEVFTPGDTLKVITPVKVYNFNSMALEMFPKKEIAKNLIGHLRKDTKVCSADYRGLLRDLENLRTDEWLDGQTKAMMYSDILRKLRNLRYVGEKKLLDFADVLKKMEGQKHVFLFHQKLLVPLLGDPSLEDFEAFVYFDAEKVNQAFSDSSISIHFIFLTKTSGLGVVSTDRISVTSRGLNNSGNRIPDPVLQDISGSFFSTFKDIAQATGGTVNSSANAASSFKKAVNASENYYLIYYNPKSYKADGKFKKITVKVKGKRFRVTHRAGYLAD